MKQYRKIIYIVILLLTGCAEMPLLDELPEAPVLAFPSNNATNVALTLTLSWNASTGATSYTLQYALNSAFTTGLVTQIITSGSSYTPSGLANSTLYYWRVNAKNSLGTSSYSSVYSFTTAAVGITCHGIPTVIFAGKTYNTVKIDSICWLKENLDVGTMTNGIGNQSNNGTIEKYCYENNAANCDTYGGLYQWNEAMQYVTTPGSRGICPPGWHIPTKAELEVLSTSVGSNANALKAVGQGTGNGAGTNNSGFSTLLTGYRHYDGTFYSLSYSTVYWSSSEFDVTYANYMNLFNSSRNINYYYNNKDFGFSIRCAKD